MTDDDDKRERGVCGMSDAEFMAYLRGRKALTSGQIARLCGVAPRTVGKWMDSGRLPGYRLPCSRARRVMKADLVDFLKRHGMPSFGLTDMRLLFVVAAPEPVACGLAEVMGPRWEVAAARGAVEASAVLCGRDASCVLLDYALGGEACRDLFVMATNRRFAPPVLAITTDDRPAASLEGKGYAAVLERPVDALRLCDRVCALTAAG